MLEQGLEAAAAVGADSRRRDAEILEATAAADARLRELSESLREAVNRAAEAIDSLADLAEQARLLADAKDAENLQRATRGPARKMEIMFEEFGRQQEALLAELVGRRRHLDDLIGQLRSEGSSVES